MHLFHLVQRWLMVDPPGINHIVTAVFAVALVWVVFERFGPGARTTR